MSKKALGETTITEITIKKNLAVISFSDAKKITLSHDSYSDFHLYKGKVISEKEYVDLAEEASYDDFYRYALKLVTSDSYSVYALRLKLLDRGADKKNASKVIDKIKALGLLNDEIYAKTFAEDVAPLKLFGKNRIVFYLNSKGISESIISKLSFPEEKELEKACNYAKVANRKLSSEPSLRKRRKMFQALIERGFDPEIAEEALSKIFTPTSKEAELERLSQSFQLAISKYSRKLDGYKLNKKVFAYLVSRGYQYDDILKIMEENNL